MKKILLVILVLILLAVTAVSFAAPDLLRIDKKILPGDLFGSTEPVIVNNFDDCVRAGNPVMESYPRQCMHEGKNYVEDIQSEDTETTDITMTEVEARVIAQNSCIKGGESIAPGTYNATTKTWWFDANLNSTKPGCSPACVVSVETGKAEINWRCTGLIMPEEKNELTGKQWLWLHTRYSTDQMDTPKNPDIFGLQFDKTGSVAISSDCNSMRANYTVAEQEDLRIESILSTKMACADSQEAVFAETLLQVNSYNFSKNGQLNLVLKDNKGVMVFK